MSFKDDFAEYMQWKATLDDSPEAWEAHKEREDRASKFDPIADGLLDLVTQELDMMTEDDLVAAIRYYLDDSGHFDHSV